MIRTLIIPAAGLGTRLRSGVPKALVEVAGWPMLSRLLAQYSKYAATAVVVAAPGWEHAVREVLRAAPLPGHVAVQARPTGMLDAILAALPHAEGVHPDRVWVTWCDQLAVRDDTLDDLVREESQAPEPALVMPTHTGVDPYIHFARGDGGRITRVLHRREGDAMPPSGESDIGLFSLSTPAFLDRLVEFAAAAEHGPRTGERNFLPFIPWLAHRAPVVTFPCHDPIEALGINTPEDLARVEAYLAARDPAARR